MKPEDRPEPGAKRHNTPRRGPLRVLHLVHSLAPGGMENGVVNVASHLDPGSFEIHACCLDTVGAFAQRLPQPQNVVALEKPEGFDLPSVRNVARVVREKRPDVVHTHNLGPLIYGALATRFGATVPILHGEHGQPDDGASSRKRHLQRRLFFRAAKRVQTVSEGLRDHFVRQGFPPEQLVAITNGVDTRRFAPGDRTAAKQALGLNGDEPVVGIVGRLIPSKQHLRLIGAFEQFVERTGSQARLLIVGAGGSEEAKIEKAAGASRFSHQVLRTGFQADPAPFYQAMDLLACPSTVEGLSNAVLEAMACGVPALAHNACGTSEVLAPGQDGILGDLSSTRLLADALQRAFADREALAGLGREARQKVVDRFALDRMASRYGELYQEVSQV